MSDLFLQSCAGYLRKQDTLKDAWDSAMTLHMRSCPLGRTETDVIKDISMGLGRSDTGGQAKVFTPAILRLEKCLSEAREQENWSRDVCTGGSASRLVSRQLLP
ncbi:MAG: hypothetical protein V8Q42_04005 [Anaerovoracaceae bacterium]